MEDVNNENTMMNSLIEPFSSFISSPIKLIDGDGKNKKTLSIPIKKLKSMGTDSNPTRGNNKIMSKSWSGYSEKMIEKKNYSVSPIDHSLFKNMRKKNYSENIRWDMRNNDFKPYDAINNCKSAGIIPYSIRDGKLLFLLQKSKNPIRKKDSGWNDFGGKKMETDTSTAETAAREFSEETSCLFYLKENSNEINKKYDMYYNLLKDNNDLFYDDATVKILKKIITISQKYYTDKITEFVLPIHISSKETYISYFVNVPYIPEEDLPKAEDIHIPYETRYIRTCKWFNMDELMSIDEKDIHKRLQITRIQQRINNYNEKKLFT